MVPHASHTCRASRSPGGTRSSTRPPHWVQKFMVCREDTGRWQRCRWPVGQRPVATRAAPALWLGRLRGRALLDRSFASAGRRGAVRQADGGFSMSRLTGHTGRCRLGVFVLLGLLAASAQAQAQAQASDHALMRYPTLHGDTVVFVAHDNLWSVPRSGGVASRLTTDPGRDVLPRYSPDGKWIAFTGEYQGNRDVYVIPAGGGPARRLTFISDVAPEAPLRWGPNNMVVTWTPDSKSVVFLSRRNAWNSWYGLLFEVPVTGGLPVPLPLDRGGFLSYGPSGHEIAYNRIMRNFRTWKRYT